MICSCCLGRQKVLGLGNMIKNCLKCGGTGVIDDIETGGSQAPRLEYTKRKRRSPAEMAALRDKESKE